MTTSCQGGSLSGLGLNINSIYINGTIWVSKQKLCHFDSLFHRFQVNRHHASSLWAEVSVGVWVEEWFPVTADEW